MSYLTPYPVESPTARGKSLSATEVCGPSPFLSSPNSPLSPVELFKCPFPIYVDASRRLYHLMGMTKLSNDFGPFALKDRAAYHQHAVPRQVVSAIGVGSRARVWGSCRGADVELRLLGVVERAIQDAACESRDVYAARR